MTCPDCGGQNVQIVTTAPGGWICDDCAAHAPCDATNPDACRASFLAWLQHLQHT